jgi:hypothetical protein
VSTAGVRSGGGGSPARAGQGGNSGAIEKKLEALEGAVDDMLALQLESKPKLKKWLLGRRQAKERLGPRESGKF